MIDRQSALSVCKEYGWVDDEDFIDGYNTAIKDIREAIKELPTVEAELVRHGRWKCISEYEEFSEEMADYLCERCGHVISRLKNQKPKFCEECGARMDADHIADVSKKVGIDDGK